MLNPGNDLGVA